MSTAMASLSADGQRQRRFLRMWLLVLGMMLSATMAATAHNEALAFPGLSTATARKTTPENPLVERVLTPADAPLQVTRKVVLIQLTNAYDPSGIRYMAIQLGFRNTGTTDLTVNTKASQLLVGNEEFLRVQVREELPSYPIELSGEVTRDVEDLQGKSPVTVKANGPTAEAWLVFARLPRTRDLPAMTLRLTTSVGKIDIDLTRIENEGLTFSLERIGPSGRIGIVRVSGELNVINAPHFAKQLSEYADQGVSRLVVVFEKGSSLGDELTAEWLVMRRGEESDRLQFYPHWSGLVRRMILVDVPGEEDETGEENRTHSEAEAIQRVTHDFIPGLDAATFQRESRSGHPLFRRAMLLNAGDAMANDNDQSVLEFLESPDEVVRRAAIQSLRSALDPRAVTTLEGLVRRGSREAATLAFRSLNTSQQTLGRELALQLALDTDVQKRIGLAQLLRTIGSNSGDRWLPFLKQSFESGDPLVRLTALMNLLQMGTEERFPLLETALADKDIKIRDLAFQSMVPRRSTEEQPLFARETMKRFKAGRRDDMTLTALREIRDPAVLPQLLKWIDDGLKALDETNQYNLVSAYAEIGGAEALGELIPRMPRFSRENQKFLLSILYQARHPETRRLAVAGLLVEDSDTHDLCQAMLVEFGDAAAVAALSAAIDKALPTNDDTNRATQLAHGLGAIGTPEAVQVLEALKNDTNPKRRKLGLAGLLSIQYASPVNNWLQAATHKTQQEDYLGAIQLLNIALEVDPQSGRTYNALGFAQLRLATGDSANAMSAEAKANFEKALKLTPEDHNPLTGIAICLALEGRCDEAIALVDTPQLLRKYQDQQIYLYNVACVYGRSIEHIQKTPDYPQRDQKLRDYPKKALLFLNAAIGQGFVDIDLLTNDPDLNPLRELPEFKKLSKRILEEN